MKAHCVSAKKCLVDAEAAKVRVDAAMEAVREYLRSTGERAIKAEIALQRGAEEAARTHATEATNAATEVKAKEAAAKD